MGKNLRERLQLHKISKKKIAILSLAVITIGVISGVTLAKYYANNSNKGVTAAANYYFSSDVLDDALNKADSPAAGYEEWKKVYNTNAWDGASTYDFKLKIRNYENQLLYNSKNLDVTYEITFTLLDDNAFDGGTYSVAHGSDEQPLVVGNSVTLTETIQGGTATSDEFHVYFTAPDDAPKDYQSEGVLVVAKITGPDFLAKTETKIGAVLHVGKIEAQYKLEGTYDFTGAEQIKSTDTEWTDTSTSAINAMAAFPYAVTYTPGTDNAAHQIQISWDNTYLELDQFDENYENVVENQDGTSSITVYIQPNETFKLTFYRTDDFSLNKVTPEGFWKLVTVTDLTKSGNKTSGN